MTHKPRAAVTDEHLYIWLSPKCVHDCERTWCQDNNGPCDECGAEWTKYALADASLPKSSQTDTCPPQPSAGIGGECTSLPSASPQPEGDEAMAERIADNVTNYALLLSVFNKWNADSNSISSDLINAILAAGFRRRALPGREELPQLKCPHGESDIGMCLQCNSFDGSIARQVGGEDVMEHPWWYLGLHRWTYSTDEAVRDLMRKNQDATDLWIMGTFECREVRTCICGRVEERDIYGGGFIPYRWSLRRINP